MVAQIELTDSLRQYALDQLDIDLLGVAPVDRLAEGPEGARPTDYLPGATSVVVCAAKIPDAAIEAAGHYEEPGRHSVPICGMAMWF